MGFFEFFFSRWDLMVRRARQFCHCCFDSTHGSLRGGYEEKKEGRKKKLAA